MPESVGAISLDLDTNYKPFQSQLQGISGQATGMVSSAFKKLGFVVAAAFSVKKLADFGKASIEMASNLNEVQNVVDVVFGESSQQVNNFAKSALTSYGLSELSAKKYTSTMGAMLKSMGLTGTQVVGLSESVAGLAGDMASFYNLETDEAFSKIRSGISGETEPLKQLGINMSVANMQAFALSQGIKKSYESMSQSEQALLRYNYLLSVTKDAQGDFSRTSSSWANQVRLLKEQWNSFKAVMGSAFIQVLTPVLQGLNVLIQKLQVAAQYFKAFVNVITGNKQSVSSTTNSMGQAAKATTGVGNATEKAAKKIKGSTASFDTLNILAQDTADSMADATDSLGSAGAIDLGGAGGQTTTFGMDLDTSKFEQKFNSFKQTIGGMWQFVKDTFEAPFMNSISRIVPPLQSFGQVFMGIFADIQTLSQPFLAWLQDGFTSNIIVAFDTISLYLANMLTIASTMINTLWQAVIYPALNNLVTTGLPMISEFANGAMTTFQVMSNVVTQAFLRIWTEGAAPVLNFIGKMWTDVMTIIENLWSQYGATTFEKIQTAFNNVGKVFNDVWTNILQPIIGNLVQGFNWVWDTGVKPLIEHVGEFAAKLFNFALDIYNGFIAPVASWFAETFGPAIATTVNFVVDIIMTIVKSVANVASGIFESLGGVLDFLSGVFTGDWEKAWNGIKDIFSGVWDALVGIAKTPINLIIDCLNGLIGGMNNFSIDIPDFVPKELGGGTKIGFNIPEIPKLAQGALISRPTLAMVGEAGTEAVVPLKNTSFVNSIANAVLKALQPLVSGLTVDRQSIAADSNGNITIVLKIGDFEFARAAIKSINRYQKQIGRIELEV
jgi:phage-related protein